MPKFQVLHKKKGYAVFKKYWLGWFRHSLWFKTEEYAEAALKLRLEVYEIPN